MQTLLCLFFYLFLAVTHSIWRAEKRITPWRSHKRKFKYSCWFEGLRNLQKKIIRKQVLLQWQKSNSTSLWKTTRLIYLERMDNLKFVQSLGVKEQYIFLPNILPLVDKIHRDTSQNWCQQCNLSINGQKNMHLRLCLHTYPEQNQKTLTEQKRPHNSYLLEMQDGGQDSKNSKDV